MVPLPERDPVSARVPTTAVVMALGALLALSLFAQGVGGAVDTGPDALELDGGAVEPDDGPGLVDQTVTSANATGNATFSTSAYRADRGDVVEITVELSDADRGALATVSLGDSNGTNYTTGVTVADSDGDGAVTIFFNTYTAGTHVRDRVFWAESGAVENWRGEDGGFVERLEARYGGAGVPAGTEGDLANRSRARRALLPAGDYRLSVVGHEGNQSVDTSRVDDVATLSLADRAAESSQVMVVPAGDVGAFDREYVRTNAGTSLTRSVLAARGEAVVHRVVASGLEGAIRNWTRNEGYTIEEAFFAESGRDGIWNAAVEQVDIEPEAERPRFRATAENSRVVGDPANDTFYVAFDLDEVGYFSPNLEDGERWSLQFHTSGVLANDTVRSNWTYRDSYAPLLPWSENRLRPRNASEAVIRNSVGVTVAPGTELSLAIEATDPEASPLSRTLETTVGPNRTVAFRTDLSDVPVGTEFRAVLRRDGTQLDDGSVYSGEVLAVPPAAVTVDDQNVTELDPEVTVASARLESGGFVALHAGNASGPVVGSSASLAPGNHSALRIDLARAVPNGTRVVAVAHRDTDGDVTFDFDPTDPDSIDGPYTDYGSPVADDAVVTVVEYTGTFRVSNLKPTGIVVEPGEIVETVAATVQNAGERRGIQSVEFRVGDAVVANRTVSLAAGESTTVSFENVDTSALAPGSYTYGVASASDDALAIMTVESLDPPNFRVTGLSPSAVTAAQGEVIETVSAQVENVGDRTGTQTVALRIDERVVARQQVTLDPGDQWAATFDDVSLTELSPGAYTIGVSSANDSATGALAVEAPSLTATPSPTPTATPTPTETPSTSSTTATPTASDTATATATPTGGTDGGSSTDGESAETTATTSGSGPGLSPAVAMLVVIAVGVGLGLGLRRSGGEP